MHLLSITSQHIGIVNMADEVTKLDAKSFRSFNINLARAHTNQLVLIAGNANIEQAVKAQKLCH
jgi:hypothetical protein